MKNPRTKLNTRIQSHTSALQITFAVALGFALAILPIVAAPSNTKEAVGQSSLGFHSEAVAAIPALADDRSSAIFPHREIVAVPASFDSQAADFNGDGNLDLAVLSDSGLYITLGDGNGHFSPPVKYNPEGFQTILAVGDFNGDGFPDVAVANFPGINVLLNDGAGGFPTSRFLNTGKEPSGLAVADFDGDGNLDLAVSDFQANSISILSGDGKGRFAGPITFATGTSPSRLVAADFDNDGVPDLAVVEYGSMDLRIFKGVGNGHFRARATYLLGGNVQGLVTADFNNDGYLDLAVEVFNIFPNNHVAVFLGHGKCGFVQSASLSGNVFLGLAVADLNGDGDPDLIFLDETPQSPLDMALGDGAGGFHAVHRITLAHSSGFGGNYTVSTGDFDRDGRIDLFTTPGKGVVFFNTL